eukprot:4303856-Prymnesium_polylepis.1
MHQLSLHSTVRRLVGAMFHSAHRHLAARRVPAVLLPRSYCPRLRRGSYTQRGSSARGHPSSLQKRAAVVPR